MAIGATIHSFEVQLADVDRGVYDDISLRVAQHPSETSEYLITRVLAYCLEYTEGIEFAAGGVSSTDEPAVFVKDLSGHWLCWIEIGAPDAERLHFASKLADRTVVYTHRDPVKLISSWAGKTIHRAEAITINAFDPGFVVDAARRLERRNRMTVSVTEGQLYLDLNGASMSSTVHRRPIVAAE